MWLLCVRALFSTRYALSINCSRSNSRWRKKRRSWVIGPLITKRVKMNLTARLVCGLDRLNQVLRLIKASRPWNLVHKYAIRTVMWSSFAVLTMSLRSSESSSSCSKLGSFPTRWRSWSERSQNTWTACHRAARENQSSCCTSILQWMRETVRKSIATVKNLSASIWWLRSQMRQTRGVKSVNTPKSAWMRACRLLASTRKWI